MRHGWHWLDQFSVPQSNLGIFFYTNTIQKVFIATEYSINIRLNRYWTCDNGGYEENLLVPQKQCNLKYKVSLAELSCCTPVPGQAGYGRQRSTDMRLSSANHIQPGRGPRSAAILTQPEWQSNVRSVINQSTTTSNKQTTKGAASAPMRINCPLLEIEF